MQCPIDGERLVITERSGVEIDYCPKCRGVWLDRGELDKILERAAGAPGYAPAPTQPQTVMGGIAARAEMARSQGGISQGAKGYSDRDDHYDRRRGKHKKESFLSNLFDF